MLYDENFRRELKNSMYIHKVLPLHRERSLEAEFPGKNVVYSRRLWPGLKPVAANQGQVAEVKEEGGSCLCMTAPFRSDHWPEGAASNGDYSNFGTASMCFMLQRESWEAYNRLHFWVKPAVGGCRIAHVNISVKNEGEIPLPDVYFREGAHVVDLIPDQWNECFWEFEMMPRDGITQLTFYVFLSGHDICMDDTMTYFVRDIYLEQVEGPEKEHGWECAPGHIAYSTAGYYAEGAKTAVANIEADDFSVICSDTGREEFHAPVQKVKNERGCFSVLDFSPLSKTGMYRICVGGVETPAFPIGTGIAEESVWRSLNFLFGERCGTPVPGRHGTCHFDMVAYHNGLAMSYAGGWHDAGDVSQQTAQSAEIVHALLENAMRYPDKPELHARLVEEAEWGIDFILRTRFGDGFRATSAGATRFTDGLIGNMDDVAVRVHDHAYENFLFAGVEAYASWVLREEDPALSWGCLKAAREDFAFARAKFEKTGVEPAHMFEHTYNSGRSQYYAAACFAASQLYRAGGVAEDAQEARSWGDKLLACQETGEAGLPFDGFFWRDEQHRTIVHFNHQSREQQFAQALAALYETQPDAPQKQLWLEAMERYGGYLKAIVSNTAPFGMLPAGVYRLDEAEDSETFPYLHVTVAYENEKQNYAEQLANGKPLGNGYVLRNFPVWFSFRGNTAVLCSMGKSASLLGRILQDEILLQIGREQLYWMWGKNPFCQSLIYGAGNRYCSQYAVLCGELSGEMPVGVETRGNEDIPYWPQNNNATYREVWTSAVSRWLWLAADYAE